VFFNASASYVVNCSTTIAGYNFIAGNLQCKYIHAPNSRTYSGNYNLTLNWVLTTANSNEVLTRSGDWKSNYSNVVEFTELFASGGTHMAYRELVYNSP
jgi:hypothetical protein